MKKEISNSGISYLFTSLRLHSLALNALENFQIASAYSSTRTRNPVFRPSSSKTISMLPAELWALGVWWIHSHENLIAEKKLINIAVTTLVEDLKTAAAFPQTSGHNTYWNTKEKEGHQSSSNLNYRGRRGKDKEISTYKLLGTFNQTSLWSRKF